MRCRRVRRRGGRAAPVRAASPSPVREGALSVPGQVREDTVGDGRVGEILGALGAIMDPDLNEDIVSCGFVHDIEIAPASGGEELGGAYSVRLRLVLTTPACPIKQYFVDASEEALVTTLPWVASASVLRWRGLW